MRPPIMTPIIAQIKKSSISLLSITDFELELNDFIK